MLLIVVIVSGPAGRVGEGDTVSGGRQRRWQSRAGQYGVGQTEAVWVRPGFGVGWWCTRPYKAWWGAEYWTGCGGWGRVFGAWGLGWAQMEMGGSAVWVFCYQNLYSDDCSLRFPTGFFTGALTVLVYVYMYSMLLWLCTILYSVNYIMYNFISVILAYFAVYLVVLNKLIWIVNSGFDIHKAY